MTKQKHTPAPWEIEPAGARRGSWIGYVSEDGTFHWAALACGETEEEAAANAYLIAAAPLLKNALIELLKIRSGRTVRMANAALATALGEEHDT